MSYCRELPAAALITAAAVLIGGSFLTSRNTNAQSNPAPDGSPGPQLEDVAVIFDDARDGWTQWSYDEGFVRGDSKLTVKSKVGIEIFNGDGFRVALDAQRVASTIDQMNCVTQVKESINLDDPVALQRNIDDHINARLRELRSARYYNAASLRRELSSFKQRTYYFNNIIPSEIAKAPNINGLTAQAMWRYELRGYQDVVCEKSELYKLDTIGFSVDRKHSEINSACDKRIVLTVSAANSVRFDSVLKTLFGRFCRGASHDPQKF